MSLWNRDIFGRTIDKTPASPVTKRVLRMHALRMFEVGRAMLVLPALMTLFGSVIQLDSRTMEDYQNDLIRDIGSILLLGIAWVALPWLGKKYTDRIVIPSYTRAMARGARRGRRHVRRFVVAILLISAMLGGAASALDPQTSVWLVVLVAACMMLMVASVYFFFFCIIAGRQVGTRLACARCGYPMRTWRGASDRCPECGSEWRMPWKARLGSVQRYLSDALFAIVCLVFAFLLILRSSPFFGL